MKKTYLIFLFFITAIGYSQSHGISYQAVLLNPKGEQLPGQNNNYSPLLDKNVCLRFEIKNSNDQLEYQETINTKTDSFGMVNLIIGSGNQTGGTAVNFNAISWNAIQKKLVVALDSEGNCNSFIEISNQDFTGVPFAFSSQNSENVTGIVAIANGGTGAATATGAINALLPSQTSANGKVLTSDGTNVSWSSPGGNTHYVGELYGGGIVFYTYDNGAHGLIAGVGGNLTYKWSTAITPIAARSKGVLGGKSNSMLILSNMKIESSIYAAQAANEYSVTSNGFTFGDWYLPSMDEMCLLKDFCVANNSNILVSGREYWTSNDDDVRSDGVAWQFVYNGGATVCNDPGHRVQWRSVLNYIVPIRAF